jgi:hypothetical protein
MAEKFEIESESLEWMTGPAAGSSGKAVAKMKSIKILMITALVTGMALQANAYRTYRGGSDVPEVDVWVNKGPNSTYYYGEDIAVYFRAERDCYVVVYDIDPSGEVTILYPTSPFGSAYVAGDRVYRVPDYNDEFGLEVSGVSGTDHVFAVASYEYLNPPDFMRYIGYEYGDPDYYNDSYFVMTLRGDIDQFVDYVNERVTRGPYAVVHAQFRVNSGYRHHAHYRYWDPDPYYVGSVWVGCDWPGAEIWIDGVYFGIAPMLIPSIYYGHHWVWVYYGGYPCYQRYFYINDYHRYYINVTIDNRYRDYHYRRHTFDNWRFEERRHKNEDGFREKAIRARQNKVRTRSLPSQMVLDLNEKGAIRAGAPIVQQAREGIRVRAEKSADNRVRASVSEKPADNRVQSTRSEKGSRAVDDRTIEKRIEKENISGEQVRPQKSREIDVPEKPAYYIKNEKVEKDAGKPEKDYVKENKEQKSTKSESKQSKSSYKQSDNKSSAKSNAKSSSNRENRSSKSPRSSGKTRSEREDKR